MSIFKKKSQKAKRDSRTVRYFRVLLWRVFVKFKVRERVAKANKWADQNRGRTMLITVCSLLFLLILGSALTLSNMDNLESNFMSGVETVEPMFREMQRIQNAKAYQISQMQALASKGQLLKHELDSLVRLSDKSHKDSVQIISKYKQLEIIVNNLEGQ